MTHQDIALLLQLDAAGKTQAEIGAILGVSQAQISRLLSDFGDTRALAKRRLQASADRLATVAMTAADKGASHGDGSVALELLDRLDVAAKKRDDRDRSTKVLVMVGRADPAALPDFTAALPTTVSSSSS